MACLVSGDSKRIFLQRLLIVTGNLAGFELTSMIKTSAPGSSSVFNSPFEALITMKSASSIIATRKPSNWLVRVNFLQSDLIASTLMLRTGILLFDFSGG